MPTKLISDEQLLEILSDKKFQILDVIAKEIGVKPAYLRMRVEQLKKKGLVSVSYKFFKIITRVHPGGKTK